MVNKEKKKDATLIVADVLSQTDFGRGIVKIDPEVMKELGIMSGDVVRIFGSRVTHARVMPSSPTDVGSRKIRMDKIIRGNSKVRTGEKVRIRPVEAVSAKRVVLAPQDQRIR
ncbi:MAG TPA: AAA family ATPase, partial [Candidatus Korarchaeota archaeon]|nr:AAA family ATPase [Candidatus Korarchaeota archaeon]